MQSTVTQQWNYQSSLAVQLCRSDWLDINLSNLYGSCLSAQCSAVNAHAHTLMTHYMLVRAMTLTATCYIILQFLDRKFHAEGLALFCLFITSVLPAVYGLHHSLS